jgi:hypothetical protein
MPDNFEQLGFTEEKAPPTGDFGALGFAPTQIEPTTLQRLMQRGMVDPTGGLIGQIRAAQGIRPFLRETFEPPAATLAGGLSEAQRLVSSLAPRPSVATGRFPVSLADIPQLQQPMQRVQRALTGLEARRPEQALAGQRLADIGAFAGTEEAVAPILGALGLGGVGAGLLPRLGKRGIAGFPAGAAISPQHRIMGGILGSATAGAPELLGSALRNFPNLFLGKLAKSTAEASEKMKTIGKQLYDKSFEGTENLPPELSAAGKQSIENLKQVFPTPGSKVRKSIDIYEKNPSIRGIHQLRSDLSKKFSSNLDVIQKKGLETPVETEQTGLENAIDNLAQDTRTNLAKISPEKVQQYDIAQQHWRENVVPLREFAPIRKLLGKQRLAEPSLFKAFAGKVLRGEKETPTEAIRRIVGVPRGIAQTGQLLHRRVAGVPLGVWLGSGTAGALGAGSIFGRHIL